MPDILAINDDSISVVLNDANTLFTDLSDSFSFDDSLFSVQEQPVLTDSLAFSESIAFNKEKRLYENVVITDLSPFFTGLLFTNQSLTATLSITEETSAGEREAVFETGDYGTSKVFVITDLDNVGVFE